MITAMREIMQMKILQGQAYKKVEVLRAVTAGKELFEGCFTI